MSKKPKIRRVLVLSTAHLSRPTRVWLGDTLEDRDGSGQGETHRWIDCGGQSVLACPHEYGWFVHSPDLMGMEASGFEQRDLMACFAWAHRHDCDLVLFDRDAPEDRSLPMYDDGA
ncbi:MAG: hypothetical protein OEU92_20965 [Alphaproteobacteria bacterium]|nr:hypothetical protein [Alphaproteobacteria bacterium]